MEDKGSNGQDAGLRGFLRNSRKGARVISSPGWALLQTGTPGSSSGYSLPVVTLNLFASQSDSLEGKVLPWRRE